MQVSGDDQENKVDKDKEISAEKEAEEFTKNAKENRLRMPVRPKMLTM
jgi:hypothetical protein